LANPALCEPLSHTTIKGAVGGSGGEGGGEDGGWFAVHGYSSDGPSATTLSGTSARPVASYTANLR